VAIPSGIYLHITNKLNNMKNYFIQNTKTGEVLYSSDIEQQAEVTLEEMEREDQKNLVFVPGLYVVRDVEQILNDNNDIAIKGN
jgi:ribosome-interacting GTPase 1